MAPSSACAYARGDSVSAPRRLQKTRSCIRGCGRVSVPWKRGGGAHRRSGWLGAAGATDSGGPTRERAAPRARRPLPWAQRPSRAARSRANAQACNGGVDSEHSAFTPWFHGKLISLLPHVARRDQREAAV